MTTTTSEASSQLRTSLTLARRLRFPFVLTLVVVLGLVFAAPGLRLGVRLDEPHTANTAAASWTGLWANLYQDTPAPLMYILLHGWVRLAGDGPLALRLPSLFFFALTIWVTGQLGRRLGGQWAGVVAALLIAASTTLGVSFAAQARPYALLALLAAVSTYLGCALLDLFPSRRRWLQAAALVIVTVLGVLTHPVFVFYALMLTLAGLWRSARHFLLLAAIGALAAAIYLLLMFPLLRATLPLPTTAWMSPPTLRTVLSGIWRFWSPRSSLYLVTALLSVAAARFRRASSLLRQPAVWVLFSLSAITFAGVVAVSLVKPIYNAERTPILWLPPASTLAALLFTRLDPRRWVTRLALAAMLGRTAAAAAVTWVDPEPDPARAAIAAIAPDLQCGDRIVAGGLAYAEVVYFLRQAGLEGCGVITTFPADTILHSGWLVSPASAAVAAEAAQTAEHLAADAAAPVWFFYPTAVGGLASDVLKRELDQALGQPQERWLHGTWFDRVYVYDPRG